MKVGIISFVIFALAVGQDAPKYELPAYVK